jgi:hypothetical protein
MGRAAGAQQVRDLSWLDWSFPYDLSDDGTTLLFGEQNVLTDGQYTLYLRRTDGSPAVRLGAGVGSALSPDGEWALATTSREGGEGCAGPLADRGRRAQNDPAWLDHARVRLLVWRRPPRADLRGRSGTRQPAVRDRRGLRSVARRLT